VSEIHVTYLSGPDIARPAMTGKAKHLDLGVRLRYA
jgi:hypothetical protein